MPSQSVTGTSQSAFSMHSSAMYQSTFEGTGLHRETLSDRMSQTKHWIYNAEEGTVMGRTPRDWLLYLCLHFFFLCMVIGSSSVYCGLLYWKIDWNTPELVNSSTILQTPGLGFRPQPFINSRLIRLIKGDHTTYQYHLDHIEAYIQYYENELQQGDNYMDCSQIKGRRPANTLHKTCVFETTTGLGGGNPCLKQQNYGYDDGTPCVLLKLNKIVNWVPEEFTPENVPAAIADKWSDPFSIYVVCTGDDAATRDNMGALSYYPNNGFPFKYYPFLNQQGYRSPLMFLRFENPKPGIMLFVTCRAYARNIDLNDPAQVGQVNFQLMID